MNQKRLGVLTSGGDCPGLNAVLRGLFCAASSLNWEVLGFEDGFEGLLKGGHYRQLNLTNTAGITSLGGTILGTTNRGHFARSTKGGKKSMLPKEIVEQAAETCQTLGIEALVVIGGDGSMSTALELYQAGFPIIGVPKTIDNDLEATSMTFGFDSAVNCATEALDRLQTTAASHKRVLILQVMGRHAGWIALASGLAGGADLILIPEIPFSLDKIVETLQQRDCEGKKSTLIVIAEGAKTVSGSPLYKKNRNGSWRLDGIAEMLGQEIEKRTQKEVRSCVLGHLQRGGAPTALDRILGIRFGVKAVQLAQEKKFGTMVSYQEGAILEVPIAQAIHRLKKITPCDSMITAARAMGISFGDGF